MSVPMFDGEEDAYWWLICIEERFDAMGTPEAEKLLEAVKALRNRALRWWQWWSRRHPQVSWRTFSVALLWHFKPEYRDILPISYEEEESELVPIKKAEEKEEDEGKGYEESLSIILDNVGERETHIEGEGKDVSEFSKKVEKVPVEIAIVKKNEESESEMVFMEKGHISSGLVKTPPPMTHVLPSKLLEPPPDSLPEPLHEPPPPPEPPDSGYHTVVPVTQGKEPWGESVAVSLRPPPESLDPGSYPEGTPAVNKCRTSAVLDEADARVEMKAETKGGNQKGRELMFHEIREVDDRASSWSGFRPAVLLLGFAEEENSRGRRSCTVAGVHDFVELVWVSWCGCSEGTTEECPRCSRDPLLVQMGQAQIRIEMWDVVQDQEVLGLMGQVRSRSSRNRLTFLHEDLHKHFQSKVAFVGILLGMVAVDALTSTGFFYCLVTPTFRPEACIKWQSTNYASTWPETRHITAGINAAIILCFLAKSTTQNRAYDPGGISCVPHRAQQFCFKLWDPGGSPFYGTEGRRKDGPQLPPSDKVYEYILFRGSDVKNLQIKSPSTSAKAHEQIFSDPAIIQSQYSGVLSSPVGSVCGRSLTESIQRQDSPAMSSKALPVGLASHQSVTELGPSNQYAATQVASLPSFSTSMYWQGHSGTSSSSSHSLLQSSSLQPPSMVSPLAMQNRIQTAETQAPTKVGWTTLSECGLPVSSATASSLVNLTHSPSPTSLQISDSLDAPSLLSTNTPMPYFVSMTFDGSNMPLFSSPLQDINSMKGKISGKTCPDPSPIYPRHSVHNPASSFVDSALGPLPTPQSLLTPDQFAHPRQQLISLTQNLNPNQKDTGSLTLTSSGSSVLIPSPASQAPLLPLPTSVQKPQYSASQFTEEFDFVAMNEKFKKDEVWGSLGKVTTKIEGVEDIASLNLGDRECHGMIPQPKSAYKKDDFFDTISCNSVTRGSRNGQNRLFERMKLDTETFGNFQQRPNVDYGGYGVHFRGSYVWGRGYGYGGRGRGPSFPF